MIDETRRSERGSAERLIRLVPIPVLGDSAYSYANNSYIELVFFNRNVFPVVYNWNRDYFRIAFKSPHFKDVDFNPNSIQ
ncbi:hypothetical protein G5I_12779 [Acromyrmex echinatior]|uniref:Uncharacterized protein n=1 Tax=Acromyrmex echinatior TaxID=103372 RepID=F4X387_ACREC|nr:hypothetical protein G5I_12779 [Acromyrmex echinatior]